MEHSPSFSAYDTGRRPYAIARYFRFDVDGLTVECKCCREKSCIWGESYFREHIPLWYGRPSSLTEITCHLGHTPHQTPPTPVLRLCIIKAVGFFAVEKPITPSKTTMSFSGKPRKSSRLNDA